MKLAVQSDFFIQNYGLEKGLEYIKTIGYQQMIYNFSERYDGPFATEWTDTELENFYTPIGKAANKIGLDIPFTLVDGAIYNDLLPETFEARKKLCIQALKATAYMGCNVMGIRPVSFYYSHEDVLKTTKDISNGMFQLLKTEADRLGIRLAFVNNNRVRVFSSGSYSYGCRISELMELANKYEAGIIIDPVNAHLAGERAEELIIGAGDMLVGVLLRDVETDGETPAMTRMGILDYDEISRALKKAEPSATAVMMSNSVHERYADFRAEDSFVTALSELLFEMGNVIVGSEVGRKMS